MEKLSMYEVTKDKDDYRWMLEEAGAKVLRFEKFGSYQGDWFAVVEDADGTKSVIAGAYGSCSGCDSLDAESGYEERTLEEWHDFAVKFAAPYLSEKSDVAALIRKFEEQSAWDGDAKQVVTFLKEALNPS